MAEYAGIPSTRYTPWLNHVTGHVTDHVTGHVTGHVTDHVTGHVTGHVTDNELLDIQYQHKSGL